MRQCKRKAFTLIELLVVVAVIALLLAILLPALSSARDRAKASVCMSNLRQVGVSLRMYADDYNGVVPHGPQIDTPNVPATVATNQFWYGDEKTKMGLGTLLRRYAPETRILFCPADGNSNEQKEIPKIGTDQNAYGSYLYRNRDDVERPLLDAPGDNGEGLPVRAWAMDVNSLGQGPYFHVNHGAERVHILYFDGSVRGFANRDHVFSIRPEDFEGYGAKVPDRLDAILRRADRSYGGEGAILAEPNSPNE